jgi:hypothetical protein
MRSRPTWAFRPTLTPTRKSSPNVRAGALTHKDSLGNEGRIEWPKLSYWRLIGALSLVKAVASVARAVVPRLLQPIRHDFRGVLATPSSGIVSSLVAESA